MNKLAQPFNIDFEFPAHIDFTDAGNFDTREKINRVLSGIGVNTFNRFQVFLEMEGALIHYPKLYWYALRRAYEASDGLAGYIMEVYWCFANTLPGRENLMTKEELNFLNQLPDFVTIYRAMSVKEYESGTYGVSWTLSKKIAEFFLTYLRCPDVARGNPKTIAELEVHKSDLIAYFNGRDEEEVIYMHE